MTLCDRYERQIRYLRVSVTDRCNLRCRYCMPTGCPDPAELEDLLSFDEIVGFTAAAVACGVRKVRLTGGEPLLRDGLVDLVARLASMRGIEDLAMTTNGTLLAPMSVSLRAAGLQRVNVSLDTMDADRFAYITGGGELEAALEGIAAAKDAGLLPVKLNCVIRSSSTERDARAVAAFAEKEGFLVRFIREMSLAEGVFSVVEQGDGGHCAQCNRLRLSSDGWVRPCLFSDVRFSVRELGVEEAIRRAVDGKPVAGGAASQHQMVQVGG